MYTIERTVGNSHIGADGNIKISAVVDLFQDCCLCASDAEAWSWDR